MKNLYAFELGREWKLSLAEIEALFGAKSIKNASEKLAIIETDLEVGPIFGRMGGVIRAFKIHGGLPDIRTFPHRVEEVLLNAPDDGKISFALGTIGEKFGVFQSGLRIKKTVKAKGKSIRFANKDDKNLVAIAVQKEGFTYSGHEFFALKCGEELYFASTIAVQNVDAFASRDLGKVRDMQVGMLPTKLAEMMVNIAIGQGDRGSAKVYDPFSGLGTVLIEAINMGVQTVFASDLSTAMVAATKEGIAKFSAEKERKVENLVVHLDAKKIAEFPRLSDVTHIVTEGYLGEILSQETINKDRVKVQKSNLKAIYQPMFNGLARSKFSGSIVMSIPLWDIRGEKSRFNEFFDVLEATGFELDPILTFGNDEVRAQPTLLYKRPGQTVAREICRIRRKK